MNRSLGFKVKEADYKTFMDLYNIAREKDKTITKQDMFTFLIVNWLQTIKNMAEVIKKEEENK